MTTELTYRKINCHITSRIGTLQRLKKVAYSFVNVICKSITRLACRAQLGRYPLIFDINKRILKYNRYLQSKEQSSLVIQSAVMSNDLHRNDGKTSFYTNLKKILNYYNIPFNFIWQFRWYEDHAFCKSHAEEIYYPLETLPLQFTKVWILCF